MARHTPGNYVPLDVNYARDAAIRRAGPDAELLFIRALAYCKASKSDGKVPDYDLPVVAVGLRNATKSADALVKHGLWEVTEDGWHVRSWHKWNRPAKVEQEFHEKQSEHGTRGNHQRWHVDKGVFDPACEHCPDIDPSREGDRVPDQVGESQPESGGESPIREGKGREVEGKVGDKSPRAAKRRSPETPLPDDWTPNESHRAYATQNRLDLDREVFKFRNHAAANERRQRNWNAAFNQWLATATEYGRPTQTQQPKVVRDQWLLR